MEAWRLKIESSWRVSRSVVEASQHFDVEHDPDPHGSDADPQTWCRGSGVPNWIQIRNRFFCQIQIWTGTKFPDQVMFMTENLKRQQFKIVNLINKRYSYIFVLHVYGGFQSSRISRHPYREKIQLFKT
jgi:hypothetical protein